MQFMIYGPLAIILVVVIYIWVIRHFDFEDFSFTLPLIQFNMKRKNIGALGPIQVVNEKGLRKTFTPGRGGKVNWIDRKATTVGDLRTYGRLALVGATNIGKTREAIELIRRAVEDGLVGWDSIIKPNPNIDFANPETLFEKAGIDPDKAIMLLVDDFPYHYSGGKLEQLTRLVSALERCRNLYVITTARSDQIMDEHERWLVNQRFQQIPFGILDEEKTGRLIDNAAVVYNLNLEELARTILIEGWGGTPGLILWGMELLKHEGDKVDDEAVKRIVKQSISETWQKTKRDFIKEYPSAEYLFKSLGTFYAARVTPYTYFVLRYAKNLWDQKRPSLLKLGRMKELLDALRYLASFEIVDTQGIIAFRDFAAEGVIKAEQASENLKVFLLNDHRLLQNSVGRRVYLMTREHADALTDIGSYFYRKREYQNALPVTEAVTRLLPFARAYSNLGVVLDALSQKKEAERIYRKAIEKDENFAPAYSNLGKVLSSLNRKEEAEEMFRKAIEKDENFAQPYYTLGVLLSSLNRKEEADEMFRKAIEKDENFDIELIQIQAKSVQLETKVKVNAATSSMYRNLNKEIAKYERVVKKNDRNASAWDALGTLYKSAGLYKESIQAYQQAISIDPNEASYHHHLGFAFAGAGREKEAIASFQKVVELDPDNYRVHASLGGYYRKLGLEELAQEHLGKAMRNIYASENEYSRACLDAICGNVDEAIDLLQIALEKKQTYVEWIIHDPDLDFIRDDARFKQLISNYTD
jgi:tetratricopeptide (TPR) repeat protein